jgi:ribosomal protein S18 acetylase RimI-like enzyme
MRTFREIEATDISALFRVRSATDENRLTPEELASLGITESSVAEKLRGTYKGWLCEDDGEVVGFAIGDKVSSEMWVIAVLPTHIRHGVGSKLLATVEEWMFRNGCPEIWLTTDVDTSLRAYSFYRSRGWEDWKIEKGNRYMKKRPNKSPEPTPTAVTPRAIEGKSK